MRDEYGLEHIVPCAVYRWLAGEYDWHELDDEAQELLISHDQVDSDCAWPDDEDWDEFALEYDMSERDYSGVLWPDAWGLDFQYPEAEEIGFQPSSRKQQMKKRRSGRSTFAARFDRTSDRSWKRHRHDQAKRPRRRKHFPVSVKKAAKELKRLLTTQASFTEADVDQQRSRLFDVKQFDLLTLEFMYREWILSSTGDDNGWPEQGNGSDYYCTHWIQYGCHWCEAYDEDYLYEHPSHWKRIDEAPFVLDFLWEDYADELTRAEAWFKSHDRTYAAEREQAIAYHRYHQPIFDFGGGAWERDQWESSFRSPEAEEIGYILKHRKLTRG